MVADTGGSSGHPSFKEYVLIGLGIGGPIILIALLVVANVQMYAFMKITNERFDLLQAEINARFAITEANSNRRLDQLEDFVRSEISHHTDKVADMEIDYEMAKTRGDKICAMAQVRFNYQC